MDYSARIIENGKVRYAGCTGYDPADALNKMYGLMSAQQQIRRVVVCITI